MDYVTISVLISLSFDKCVLQVCFIWVKYRFTCQWYYHHQGLSKLHSILCMMCTSKVKLLHSILCMMLLNCCKECKNYLAAYMVDSRDRNIQDQPNPPVDYLYLINHSIGDYHKPGILPTPVHSSQG